jgi:hypothetical protein
MTIGDFVDRQKVTSPLPRILSRFNNKISADSKKVEKVYNPWRQLVERRNKGSRFLSFGGSCNFPEWK